MNDSGCMSFRQSLRHLNQILQQLREWCFVSMDLMAERFAVDKLHRDVVRAFALTDLVDMRDVWMIESSGRLCFTNKPLHSITIRREVGRQNLQRDFTIELGVLPQVHLAHPACADLGDDAVM